MPRLAVSRVLPYQPEQLFDIAADVERYPDFLPWWQSARITQRSGDVYHTDQEVGFGPFSQRFTTKTILRRPLEIEVTAIDGPFEDLRADLAVRIAAARALPGRARRRDRTPRAAARKSVQSGNRRQCRRHPFARSRIGRAGCYGRRSPQAHSPG